MRDLQDYAQTKDAIWIFWNETFNKNREAIIFQVNAVMRRNLVPLIALVIKICCVKFLSERIILRENI